MVRALASHQCDRSSFLEVGVVVINEKLFKPKLEFIFMALNKLFTFISELISKLSSLIAHLLSISDWN